MKINFNEYNDLDYKIIYINYEKEQGLKIFYNFSDFKNYYNENLKFYKIYIFNDKGMDVYINSDDEVIRYSSFNEEKNFLYKKNYYMENLKKIEVTYYLDKSNNIKFYYSGLEN